LSLRIWLHEGHDGGPGLVALGLDWLGFATWAESEPELIAKLPDKARQYQAWRRHHGVGVEGDTDAERIEVVGRFTGDEILFPPDLEPARPEDVALTIRLLDCSRADLNAVLEDAPEGAFDWNPDYKNFAPWADWRSVRANLAHIANSETAYYATNIGFEPTLPAADPHGDWRSFLPQHRSETLAFLNELRLSADLTRLRTIDHGFGPEDWSVRKTLRRLVSHEIVHTKSISRVIRDYRATHPGS